MELNVGKEPNKKVDYFKEIRLDCRVLKEYWLGDNSITVPSHYNNQW